MPITRRRRLAALLVAALSFVAAVAVAIVALGGDNERIAGYWAGAVLTDDGLLVTEVIDYDFGPVGRRGIFRTIPDVVPGSVDASSPTAPDQFTVTETFQDTEIRIGDPAVTITGRHRYRIDYILQPSSVLRNGFFSWDAVGLEWTVPISNIEVRLAVPGDVPVPGCVQGTPWDSTSCDFGPAPVAPGDPAGFAASIDDLAAGEGVTVSGGFVSGGEIVAFPVPPTGPASDPGTGPALPFIVALIAALLGGAAATVGSRHAGREWVWSGGAADAAYGDVDDRLGRERLDEKQLAALATIEFEPPRDTSAVEGGLLLQERVRDEHLAAWLLESAIRGEVELTGDEDSPSLVRGTAPAHPSVHQVLDRMFDGRSEVSLESYDADFSDGASRLRNELSDWLHGSAHWDEAGRRRQTRVRVFAVLGLIVSGVIAGIAAVWAARNGDAALPFVALGAAGIGAALGAFVSSFELLIRTETGSAMWLRIESFRRFLENSEARHVDEAAEKGVLRQYTAWAVALGESKAWGSAVEDAAAANPQLRSTLARDLAFVHVGSNIAGSVRSASTAPSSSGGGGGFSGGSGGGGGGGGGGSW